MGVNSIMKPFVWCARTPDLLKSPVAIVRQEPEQSANTVSNCWCFEGLGLGIPMLLKLWASSHAQTLAF